MPLYCVGSCVWFVCWVEMSAGRTRIRCAAIAELMDMKAVVAGSQTCNFRLDLHSVSDFCEGNCAANFVACSGMKYGNSF